MSCARRPISPERVGDHPRVQHILDRDRRPEGGARVLRRPFALHDRDHRQLLVRQAVGLHVAQYGNREQSRRTHRPIGLLELAGDAGGRDHITGAPNAEAAALAMGDQYRLAQPKAIAAAVGRISLVGDQVNCHRNPQIEKLS
jgi:hypothetical protein